MRPRISACVVFLENTNETKENMTQVKGVSKEWTFLNVSGLVSPAFLKTFACPVDMVLGSHDTIDIGLAKSKGDRWSIDVQAELLVSERQVLTRICKL